MIGFSAASSIHDQNPKAATSRRTPNLKRNDAEPLSPRGVDEEGEILLPGELDVAGRAVALLGDDDLRLALQPPLLDLLRAVVVLLAVDEHHDVGVLLDRARFPQVRKPRAVVLGHFC